ncbi:MAG: sigma factor-like helix-turn-helix DNA-binding protein [Ilumatobacteraceae bacterium]
MSTTFVERFADLHRTAYRASFAILGRRVDAEDCAQEALARTMVRWSKVQSYAPAFTARVATNLALDRSRHAGKTVLSDGATLAMLGGHVDPMLDRRRDLITAIHALPNRQREAVTLRYFADLPESETAAMMKCTVGTVKSTTSKALQKLRLDLGPRWAWGD